MGNKDNRSLSQLQRASLQCPPGHIMNPPWAPSPPKAPRCTPSSCQFPSQLRGFCSCPSLSWEGSSLQVRLPFQGELKGRPGRAGLGRAGAGLTASARASITACGLPAFPRLPIQHAPAGPWKKSNKTSDIREKQQN